VISRGVAIATSSMARDSVALIGNVVINGALGLAFWLAAARLYPTEVVGTASAVISAMILAAGIGWFGWQFVLIRYLPVAGSLGGRLVASCYLVAVVVSIPAALIIGVLGPEPVRIHAGPAILVFASVIWVVFSLEDAALIGLGRAALVPIENAAFGTAKLLAIVALASSQQPMAIVGGWVASAAVAALVVNVAILRPSLARTRDAAHLPPTASLARFGVAQHVAAIATALPDSLVPLLVIAMLGPVASAHYYAAWTVAFSLRLTAVSLANVYTARSARHQDRERAQAELRPLALVLVSGLVVFGLVAAGPALSLFGPGYEAGVPVLRWMAVGMIPFAFVTLAVARHRVENRSATAVAVGSIATTVTLGLDVILLPRIGIEATGIAWLAGWTLAALLLVVQERGRNSALRAGNSPRSRP
jgi:O-antigen/teichoic acid export membrane protein